MKKLLLLAMVIILGAACSKGSSGCYKGELKDLTGLDGCGWVIELNNGTKLEPVNLSEFESSPSEGQKVCVKYTELNSASVCMVGIVVELNSME